MPHLSGHWKIKKQNYHKYKRQKKLVNKEEKKVAINAKIPLKSMEKIPQEVTELKKLNLHKKQKSVLFK